MIEKITFTGDSQLKGRNGYTSLGSADSYAAPAVPTFQGATRYINFYSRRPRVGVGAALLELNREDFQHFKEWVAQLEFDDTVFVAKRTEQI